MQVDVRTPAVSNSDSGMGKMGDSFLIVSYLQIGHVTGGDSCRLKAYVKIAWRNLIKDRQFTLLNLLGLSVGLACSLLIRLWIADELRMERYNTGENQLYQVM